MKIPACDPALRTRVVNETTDVATIRLRPAGVAHRQHMLCNRVMCHSRIMPPGHLEKRRAAGVAEPNGANVNPSQIVQRRFYRLHFGKLDTSHRLVMRQEMELNESSVSVA